MLAYGHDARAVAGIAEVDAERLVHGASGLVRAEGGACALGAKVERGAESDRGVAALGGIADASLADELRRAVPVGCQHAQVTCRETVERLQLQRADDGVAAALVEVAAEDRLLWLEAVAGFVQCG